MARPDDDQLIEQTTVEALERENTQRLEDLDASDRADPVRRAALLQPFGFMNEEWQRFKAELRAGDQLWTFSSSAESWRMLAGRAGIVLYREGQPVRQFITLMN
jgi:hypothetical protein